MGEGNRRCYGNLFNKNTYFHFLFQNVLLRGVLLNTTLVWSFSVTSRKRVKPGSQSTMAVVASRWEGLFLQITL